MIDDTTSLLIIGNIVTAVWTVYQEYRWQKMCAKCPLYIKAHEVDIK